MPSLSRSLLVATLIAAAGGTALAESPAAGMRGHGGPMHMHEHGGRQDPAQMRERMTQRMAARQAALKQKLQITPAQETAWNAWTGAMQPGAMPQRPDRAEIARLTTPERIDRMRALRAERQARMDKRADATKSFYAALTPEQQKVFDAETARMMGGRMGGGRGGRHPHHG